MQFDLPPVIYEDCLKDAVFDCGGELLPRFALEIYESREDLRRTFPNPLLSGGSSAFCRWLRQHGVSEYPGLENMIRFYVDQNGCGIREIHSNEPYCVGIILPTRNRPKLIEKALNSVLAQTYTSWVLYIVDGSTDSRTEEVCHALLPAKRFVYIREKPDPKKVFEESTAAARNLGIAESGEEVIAHLDDDNVWHPNHLRKLIGPFIDKPELGMSFALHRCIDTRSLMLLNDYAGVCPQSFKVHSLKNLIEVNYIASDDVVARREAVIQAGYFREDLPYFADWEHWLRIAFRFSVQQVYEVLTDYYIHEESITAQVHGSQFKIRCEAQVRKIIEENLREAVTEDRVRLAV